MYIIAIGWLYVTLLVAANEATLVAGIISFAFYDLLPCSLLIWLSGSRVRRERRKYRESMANQLADQQNRTDTQADQ